MTTEPLAVRSAQFADIPEMHRIRLAVRENRLSAESRITEASSEPFIAAGGAWVAVLGERIVGFAVIDKDTQSVWALFVEPDQEAAGIGSALHATMLDWAAGQGLSSLWLTTSRHSRAYAFYQKRGWTAAGSATGNEVRMERQV